MSNKTQLQTNNTALDGYIARINAAKDIAAGLPNAGSGGGSVETCTVTLRGEGPGNSSKFYYSDGTTLKQVNIPNMISPNVVLTDVIKNSIVATLGTVSSDGNKELIYHDGSLRIFFVNGDASFGSM